MYTLETIIVMPVILIFIAAIICVSLKYAEIVSKNADSLKEDSLTENISCTDVVRGGEILNELYKEYFK